MSGARDVGLVGLGRMGRGIARRLDAAGLLAAAWDTAGGAFARAGLSDAVAEAPPAAMAARVLLFAVPTTAQVRAALSGVALPAGTLVVDLTTSDPEEGRALAAELAAGGVGYVDAAMTGGAAGAEAGTLALMCGGEAAALAHAGPVLAAFAARIFHLGPVGAGQAMKLVHNAILHATFLATCEGVRLAERAGIAPARAVEVLNAGNARSYVTEVRFPRDILGGTHAAKSAVGTLAKDLGLAEGFAARLGAPVPYARLTARMLARAAAMGEPSRDFALLFPEFDAFAGEER